MVLLAITTLVVCAPGYPGNSAEAQPAMDALARALTEAAHAPVQAVYEETVEGGLRRLANADSTLLLSPLPFFLDHEADLGLTPRLMAQPKGGEPLQKWTLMAGKDVAIEGAAVQSGAGYSPRFVHAMSGLPGARIVDSPAVLSGLRKAANGDKLAVLLDAAQAQAIPSLPFAASLAPLRASPAVPVAVVATIGKRINDKQWQALRPAFLALGAEPSAREALDGVQMTGYVALNTEALATARAAYRKAR
jgi:hypothetical protein